MNHRNILFMFDLIWQNNTFLKTVFLISEIYLTIQWNLCKNQRVCLMQNQFCVVTERSSGPVWDWKAVLWCGDEVLCAHLCLAALSLGGFVWLSVHCAAERSLLSDTVPCVHLPCVWRQCRSGAKRNCDDT